MSRMLVEGVQDALHAPAAREVDHRIGHRGEHVARRDHIRLAEPDDQVAVGVRRRHVQHLDDLVGEVDLLAIREERVVRPHAVRHARRLALQPAHAVQHELVRDHGCAFETGRLPATRPADSCVEIPASVREVLVAAGVMLVGAGVDDVTDWLVGDGLDCRQHLLAHRGHTRVHDEQSVRRDLNHDVRTRSGNEVYVAPHRQRFHVAIVVGRLDRTIARAARGAALVPPASASPRALQAIAPSPSGRSFGGCG